MCYKSLAQTPARRNRPVSLYVRRHKIMSRHLDRMKQLAEVIEPDSRQTGFARYDAALGIWRPMALEDLHSVASSIKLHNGVPEAVREHFATALNLIIYSWFFYPFNVTAQLLAYVSVEFALRQRYADKPKAKFRTLVARAVREGLVTDEGFSHIATPAERQAPPFMDPPLPNVDNTTYAETLIEIIPSLRNTLAHGSNMLHMHGASSVRVCADFINQLFAPNDA